MIPPSPPVPLLLLALLAAASCAPPPERLSGEALKNRLHACVTGADTVTPFTGDPALAARLLRDELAVRKPARTGQDTLSVIGPDAKARALGIHVPAGDGPEKGRPLVLWLHGGVNGTRPDRGAEVAHYFARESDSLGFVFAAVSGERGATWFDPAGIGNVRAALALLKTRLNIDDDRVILSGVSDGGTGCYAAAMLYPDPFAGFLVCSASPDILPMLGLPFFPDNLKFRSWHVVHGGKDRLYPGERIRSLMDSLKSAGVPLTFHYHSDLPHGLDYMPQEKPAIMDFFRTARRNPLPNPVQFQAAAPLRLSWIGVDSLSGSARVAATLSDSLLHISGDGFRTLALYPALPLFTPGKRLRILVNGRTLWNKTLEPDLLFMARFAAAGRDRSFLPWTRIVLAMPRN